MPRCQPITLAPKRQRAWIIEDFLPRGEVTLLDGPSGVGKTAFVTSLAAQLTKVGDRILFISSENQLEPRNDFLTVQGADASRLIDYPLPPFDLEQTHDSILSGLEIEGDHPSIIVLDGLEELMSIGREATLKQSLSFWRHLQKYAREKRCAIIVTRPHGLCDHREFGQFQKAGTDLCRFGLAMHWHPDDEDRRVVTVARHQQGRVGKQCHLFFEGDVSYVMPVEGKDRVKPARSFQIKPPAKPRCTPEDINEAQEALLAYANAVDLRPRSVRRNDVSPSPVTPSRAHGTVWTPEPTTHSATLLTPPRAPELVKAMPQETEPMTMDEIDVVQVFNNTQHLLADFEMHTQLLYTVFDKALVDQVMPKIAADLERRGAARCTAPDINPKRERGLEGSHHAPS
jgi:hypothetical protein